MSSVVSNTPGLRSIQATEARAQIPLIYNPTTGDYDLATSSDGLLNVATFVWNTGTLSWDKAVQSGGGGGGGGPATIADGADVTQGAIADAAVITDAAGTLSGKLRGLVKWAFERMPVSLGQKLMADSFPVVIASNQSAVPISDGGGSITVDGTVEALFLGTLSVNVIKVALTPSAPATGTVGVASAALVAANGTRRGLIITNLSNANVFLGINAAAVLNSGIALAPFGSFEMDEFSFDNTVVNAIASAAGSTVAIQEFNV